MTDMTVPNTILQQLGGRTFKLMTGASNFSGTENALTFKLPSNITRNHISHVRVTLCPSDTYKMEFIHVRGMKIKTISEHEDIYAEDLCELFRRETGLETRMPRFANSSTGIQTVTLGGK